MSLFNPFSWFGGKAYQYGKSSLKNIQRSGRHHEEIKARDAIEANKDAQAYRTNNDLVASYIKALQSGVVGTGFTFQYKSDDEKLNQKVESWFNHWSEIGNCEITGRFFRQDAERFLVAETGTKGGLLVRHHWDKRLTDSYGKKIGYKFEILSTDTIDRTKNDFATGLFFGVQTTQMGTISEIHIYENSQRLSSKKVKMKNLTLFVDIWTDPHQYTNVTPIAPILNTLDRLATYTTAEIDGAKKRSEKSVIIATEAYTIMLEAQKQYIKEVQSQYPNGSQEVEAAQREYQEIIAGFSATGLHDGAVPIMPGDNTQVWDLKTSGDTVYADISLNSKQIISRGLGLSASTVAGLPESSYNVALKNAQADEREYAIVGQKIIEKLLKTIYRNAIEAGYMLNKYEIKNYFTNKIEYNGYIKITRKQISHIDPIKSANANKLAKDNGFSSTVAIVANDGRDYLDVIRDEITYELARKKAFEDANLVYVQSGQEQIAVVKEKNNTVQNKGQK